MKIPTITGIIRRRILLNYRLQPDVAKAMLPRNFRPKMAGGYAVAGICLIRLEKIRPKGMPAIFGISSENSAHRIAVEWEGDDGLKREGVFIPRRDTNSWMNAAAGGRIFPGVHHFSKFTVSDHDGKISLRVDADDIKSPLVDIELSETEVFPVTSIFGSIKESSKFFEAGCVGYSTRPNSCVLDGILLKAENWRISALSIEKVHCAFYGDKSVFPEGSIELDHALLMRDISHEWHSEPAMRAE